MPNLKRSERTEARGSSHKDGRWLRIEEWSFNKKIGQKIKFYIVDSDDCVGADLESEPPTLD
jgi:hypothetical protein